MRDIPKNIVKVKSDWNICFWTWRMLHYGLGSTAVICSIIVATLSGNIVSENQSLKVMILSVTAAICTGLLAFVNANAKSKAYIRAWRLLDNHCIEFQLDGTKEEKSLAETVKSGQKIIEKADD